MSLTIFFQFFMKLYATSKYLSHSQFDAHQDKAFTVCRGNVFDDRELLSLWSRLFPLDDDSCTEQEIELSQRLVHELYCQVSEHYIRICFVDALHK